MEALVGSKRTATIFTWAILLVFASLIGVGWWHLLSLTFRNSIVAAVVAAGLTFIAVLCARQIGQYRADAIRSGERRQWHHGWRPYLFLAIISALGTLNAAFYVFEGRAILRRDIATVRSHYSNLRDIAAKTLPPAGYAEKEAQLDGRLASLHEEIVNPNQGKYCGVGDKAKVIIAEIRTLLPDYKVLNGSGAIIPCDKDKAEAVYRSYEAMAQRMIRGDQQFLGADGPRRLAFLERVESRYGQMDDDLERLEASASGIGGTETLTKGVLYNARNHYNEDRATLASLVGGEAAGLPPINALQSDMTSYASTFGLMLKRATELTTWFYLLVALALDFAVIFLITQLNVRYGSRKDNPTVVEAEPRFRSDPRFLWANPKFSDGAHRW